MVFLTATILSVQHWPADAYLFVLATLGYGFALGGYAARRFRQEPRVRRVVGKQWVVAHIIGMIGSCTILWTAFYVDNAHLIPGLKHLPTLTCLRAAHRDRASVPGGIPLPFCTENGQAHAIRYSFERRQMMARIEGMERRRTLVARLAFFLSRRSYGRVITPARIYALDSGLLLAVGLMEEVQEWAKQTSAPLKQLARMLVAWRVGCPWCLDFGTMTSEKLGVTEEQLRALPDYEHSPLFSEEERAVLRYADAMTRTPVRAPDAVFDALKARYTDRQILELTAVIAWENFHARVNHALNLEAEDVASRVCLVPAEVQSPGQTPSGEL